MVLALASSAWAMPLGEPDRIVRWALMELNEVISAKIGLDSRPLSSQTGVSGQTRG